LAHRLGIVRRIPKHRIKCWKRFEENTKGISQLTSMVSTNPSGDGKSY